MLALDTAAPAFSLPDTAGVLRSPHDIASSQALLVMFICNHCPFVKHVLGGLIEFARDYQPKGIGVVAISSNDVAGYPEDSPQQMALLARQRGFTFPYLYDESQDVAKAYGAICTPDFFLFDSGHKLAYRGQFDSSRPGNHSPVNGTDLRAAADACLVGRRIEHQIPSVGCSIKWKRGQQPEWA
jgi:peroxiredoxin